jgi:hypothetical protein
MPTIEPQDPRLTIDEIMSLSQGAYSINFYGQVPTITILFLGLMNVILTMKRN